LALALIIAENGLVHSQDHSSFEELASRLRAERRLGALIPAMPKGPCG